MLFLRKTCRDYVQTRGINQTTILLNSGNTIVCPGSIRIGKLICMGINVWTMKVNSCMFG